jgi:hypothetical protein
MSYFGKYGDLGTSIEGAYQFGDNGGKDIAAYTAAVDVSYNFNPLKLSVGFDMLSGTAYDETEKYNTYSNKLAAKHKFMGNMDYFASMAPYKNAGVNDFYLALAYGGAKSDWVFTVAAHMFTTNAKTVSDKSDYGQEIDLNIKYNVTKGVFFEWGSGFFMQGEYMKDVYAYLDGTEVKYREDLGAMMYFRTVVKL